MNESPTVLTPRVAIIGGGPAGLNAAKQLAPALPGGVMVFEREANPGGIPRHAEHPGYGIRDRKRFSTGPRYASMLVQEARRAGAQIVAKAMVTGWHGDDTLVATTPKGRVLIRPEVFIFATGARERPRSARRIPGTRPAGVLTTGQLQNLVHVHHQPVGKTAVIVGAELVSWSAVLTLKEAGCSTAALVSEHPKGESYWLFREPGKIWFRTQVQASSKVVSVLGKERVSGVVIENTITGKRSTIPCDTVVFTGDWIPDNELLRMAGVEIDPASLSPVVDAAMRTSRDNIFSVGNVNHPVETADVVALEGEYVAERVLDHLAGVVAQQGNIDLVVSDPICWVSPSRYAPGGPPPARDRLVAWVNRFIASPVVVVRQDGRQLARRRVMWPAAPGRVFRIPSDVLRSTNHAGGPVHISIE